MQSAILEALLDFLAVEQLLEQTAERNRMRLTALFANGLQDFAPAYLRKIEKNMRLKDLPDFRLNVAAHSRAYEMRLTARRKARDTTLQDTLDALHLEFAVNILKYACAAQNQDQILGTQHTLPMLPVLLDHVRVHYDEMPDLILLYYHLWGSLAERNGPADFEVFKYRLWSSDIARAERLELAAYYRNHCIRQINAGHRAYEAELATHYRMCLETDLFRNAQGFMLSAEFKNITQFMARRGQLEWLQKFGAQNLPFIRRNERPRAQAYFLGMHAFYASDFKSAKKHFLQV
ncbi:MAG: hypothetical protein AAF570_29590, partial [Bacteroidota bacterium]